VRLVPDLHERLPGVPAVPLADDEGARFRLFDSVIRFLRASAAGQSLVLILEDVHWAQSASVGLLRFLIDEMHEARILVIVTYRDIEVSEHHPLTEVLQAPSYPPQVQRIALAGLSEEEIGQLIAVLGHERSATLAARIHRESGGNPFFASEIVHGLGTAQAGIPGNVRDAISHRLRRLSDGCRRLLGIASVIGPEFEFATLERMAAELDDCRPLLQLVSEAEGARIVVEISGAGGPSYRFGHALIRDVLFTALPMEERLQLHWHVATAAGRLALGRTRLESLLVAWFVRSLVERIFYAGKRRTSCSSVERLTSSSHADSPGRAHRRMYCQSSRSPCASTTARTSAKSCRSRFRS
jgi:predicted ATPase